MAIRVEVPSSEADRIRREWPGSRYQVYLHNRLFDEISKAEKTLKNCSNYEAFQAAKARLLALEEVLGLIHGDDTDTTKKSYGL